METYPTPRFEIKGAGSLPYVATQHIRSTTLTHDACPKTAAEFLLQLSACQRAKLHPPANQSTQLVLGDDGDYGILYRIT